MFIDYVVLITHQTEFSTVVFLWNLYLSRNVASFTGTVSIKILVVKVKVDWKNFTTSQGVFGLSQGVFGWNCRKTSEKSGRDPE